MTRRSSSRRMRHKVILFDSERMLFIGGATLYVVGAFGGFGFLNMPLFTAFLLLVVSGVLLVATVMSLLFRRK